MKKTASESNLFSMFFYAAIIYAAYGAYSLRFVQDDAFISFRYAKNFVEGYGLVYNPLGERVEGYTNFLYTMLMTIPHYFSWDVVRFSYLITTFFAFGSLVLVDNIARNIFCASRNIARGLVAFLFINQTFSIYVTGGLETSMVCFFVLLSFYCLFHPTILENKFLQILASFASAFALMTRLDAAIFIGFFYLFYLLKNKGRKAIYPILPATIVFASYLIWKYSYYGNVLPNTFYAKLGGETNYERGFEYLKSFYLSYFLWPALLLLSCAVISKFFIKEFPSIKRPRGVEQYLVFFIVFIWSTYVVKAGGDFMEYRFFVALLPFIAFAFLILINTFLKTELLKTLFFVFVIPLSILSFDKMYSLPSGVESRDKLRANLYSPPRNWVKIGKELKNNFPVITRIATSAAGAVPYYSELYTVDTLGLNDSWIAKNGVMLSSLPGHQRITSFQYLLDQKVDFILGSPQVFPSKLKVNPNFFSLKNLNKLFWMSYDMPRKFSKEEAIAYVRSRIVQVPIGDEHFMFVLWVTTGSSKMQSFIREKGWKVYKPVLGLDR